VLVITNMKRFLLLSFVCLSWSNLVYSANIESTVEVVKPDNWPASGVEGVFVRLESPAIQVSGTNSCKYPRDGYYWYFIRKDNFLMDQLLSAALTAKVSGQKVVIGGNGKCTSSLSDSVNTYEDVRYIEIR